MTRRLIAAVLLVAVAAIVIGSAPDLARYLKMREM
jgi:hypothetical protein